MQCLTPGSPMLNKRYFILFCLSVQHIIGGHFKYILCSVPWLQKKQFSLITFFFFLSFRLFTFSFPRLLQCQTEVPPDKMPVLWRKQLGPQIRYMMDTNKRLSVLHSHLADFHNLCQVSIWRRVSGSVTDVIWTGQTGGVRYWGGGASGGTKKVWGFLIVRV